MLDLWLIAGGRCTSTLPLQIMMALLPIKHNGITCYSHEIMKFSLLKSGVPQGTYTDPVLYIARHCIPSNNAGVCLILTSKAAAAGSVRSVLTQLQVELELSTKNVELRLYTLSNIKWKLVKETFPGLFNSTNTKSMNWLSLSERSDNYLLHAYQKLLYSGIQTL